ncbi:MAG: hypothetical protein Q8N88_07180 [Nanoarchaeota archaeon]|nr:hypothetical protein [Nanoarchaeota archaeon]
MKNDLIISLKILKNWEIRGDKKWQQKRKLKRNQLKEKEDKFFFFFSFLINFK